jgi:hypothetical protein
MKSEQKCWNLAVFSDTTENIGSGVADSDRSKNSSRTKELGMKTRRMTARSFAAGAAMLAVLGACNFGESSPAQPSRGDAELTAASQGAPDPTEPVRSAPAAVQLAQLETEQLAPAARTYSVIGVGDIMMGSDWPQPGMDSRVTPGGDPSAVLGPELANLFAESDIVFGNYEGTVHSSSRDAKACGNSRFCYVFRSPPFHADYLRRAGFTIMSNANNHARDFGASGRAATFANLTRAGLQVAGGDVDGMRIAVQTLADGRRIALVAFGHNPGLLRVQNFARVSEMVRRADAQADIVMVSCHIGAEGARYDRVTRATETYLGENRGNPYRFARTAVDAGADIVFCHGPHIPRAVEVYRGRFIAYSLGNFWTYGRFNLRGHNGLAPVARLEVDAEGALVDAAIVSARQDRPGGPYLDTSGAAASRIGALTARDFATSGTRVGSDGQVTWPR